VSFSVRLVIFSLGLILFTTVFELVRKRRFREELSVIWFVVAGAIMLSSVADVLVDPLAKRLGIGYPPALVFIWVIFFLILALLYFSIVISDLKAKLKELGQKIALLEFRLERVRREETEEDRKK
jgi:hypothetical protein